MRFDRNVQSWTVIMERLYPSESSDAPDDLGWEEMQRLRGLVMVQAAETEAVIGEVLRVISPGADLQQPAGRLIGSVRAALDPSLLLKFATTLDAIETAIRKRNRVVHDRVVVGSMWVPYRTGGGEFQPVISLMGGAEYDEADLVRDFDVQVAATTLAVQLLHAVEVDRDA